MRLICGDCLTELPKLINEEIKVNLVLTDLPYGTTKCKWDSIISFDEMWEYIDKITYENSAILLFGSEPFSSYLRTSNIKYYKYDWVWDKIVRTGHLNAKKQPLRRYENISVFYKKQPTYNPQKWEGKEPIHNHRHSEVIENNSVYNKHYLSKPKFTKMKYPTNIISVNAKSKECNGLNRVHPTQKPVELLEYFIKTYTNEEDIVLDFTMGSGSTAIACKNLNRDFIGIELDEKYYKIANERLYNLSNQKKLC